MSDAGPRERVLAAVVAVAGRSGITGLTVDEVAREAGVGRASVYRWFPGGREQLVDEGITWEVGRFLGRIEAAAAGTAGLRDWLVSAIAFARRGLAEHEVLQRLLATEPGGVLPQLQQTAPVVIAVLRDALLPLVEAEAGRRADVDPGEAADWLARMAMSFIVQQGAWTLDESDEVGRLVDAQLLAGIMAPPAGDQGHAELPGL